MASLQQIQLQELIPPSFLMKSQTPRHPQQPSRQLICRASLLPVDDGEVLGPKARQSEKKQLAMACSSSEKMEAGVHSGRAGFAQILHRV